MADSLDALSRGPSSSGALPSPTTPRPNMSRSAYLSSSAVARSGDDSATPGPSSLTAGAGAGGGEGGGAGGGGSGMLMSASSPGVVQRALPEISHEEQPASEEAQGTREAWKARRKVLLDQSRDHVVANLQLHGARPPPVGAPSFVVPTFGTTPSSSSSSDLGPAARSAILPWADPRLRDDVLRLIDQFLAEEGLGATRQMLAEEWSGKVREREEKSGDARTIRKGILEGAWDEVEKLLSKPLVRSANAFRYAVYKQIFLELVDGREFQKAFTFLNKRLRGLEHYQPYAGEFKDLCYLLSAKSITDAPSFRAWEGVQPAREALVAQFSGLLEQDRLEAADDGAPYVPPHRLRNLLHMAVAYQVEFARYHPRKAPRVNTLLHDYESYVVPDSVLHTFRGHRRNVKALAWVGSEGRSLVSGSSDGSVRIWDAESARCEAVLEHGGRVWDVDATSAGQHVLSAGGDGTVKLWGRGGELRATMGSAVGDVYACRWNQAGTAILTGGYDKLVRLYDAQTAALTSTFTGHSLGISSVTFDPAGRLAITASKDTGIRLWDLNSGLAVRTLHAHLGEVTSVEVDQTSRTLLSAGKDNQSLLHDLRTLKPLVRFKGATNTRSNFVKSHFAHNSLIASGSECGTVYLSDMESGEVIQTLEHGPGVVYSARWCAAQAALASCGDDGVLRTWIWKPEKEDEESGVDRVRAVNAAAAERRGSR